MFRSIWSAVARLTALRLTNGQDLDLLEPLAKCAAQVRIWERDVRSIRSEENESLPYHKQSLKHASRELERTKAELSKLKFRCQQASIADWKIGAVSRVK